MVAVPANVTGTKRVAKALFADREKALAYVIRIQAARLPGRGRPGRKPVAEVHAWRMRRACSSPALSAPASVLPSRQVLNRLVARHGTCAN